MPVAGGPKITKTGILLEVDAANGSSYASGSSTWINVFNQGTNNGTINGTVGFDPDDSKGALTFPGTASTFVDFGNIGNLSSVWSFQVAVKPAPSASGNYTILSYASGSDTGSITYKLDYSSSNQSAVLSAYSATGSTQIVYTITGSVPTGSWSIINASYGSNVMAMYVNGAPTAYQVTTGSTVGYNANNRLYLGGTFGVTSSFYTGSMASFFAYNSDVPNIQLVQNYNAYATRFGRPPSILAPASSDPDAFRFIQIAEITGQTEIDAINNLVTGLKGAGLWNKMQAIYPFIGGTAFSHKYNLKDPTAYIITFSGVFVHDSTGIEFLGGIGDTNFAPFAALADPLQSSHILLYNNKVTLSSGGWGLVTMGNGQFGDRGLNITVDYVQGGSSNLNAFGPSPGSISTTSIERVGLFAASRTATNLQGFYRRGGKTASVFSSTTVTSTPLTGNVKIGAEGPSGWGGQRGAAAFISLGDGLTQTDIDNYYTIILAYQTALGRA